MAEARVKRGLFPFSRLMSLAAAASLTMKTRKRSDGSTVRPAEVQASLSREVVKVEPLATVMTVLRQFIDEIASELDARTDKPLAPHHWIGFVKLLGTIDQDDDMGE